MFNAYKRFFAFAGKQKKTWYKGMGYELLRSIFEAIQFIALLVVLRALVEQNVTGETALAALGVMLVSVTGAAVFWYLAHNSEGQANYHGIYADFVQSRKKAESWSIAGEGALGVGV